MLLLSACAPEMSVMTRERVCVGLVAALQAAEGASLVRSSSSQRPSSVQI
jgi:hypothetical protein